MLKTDLVLIVVQVSVVCCQLGEYRPRGGHFISNGQYQNQEQPSQNFGARGQPVNFNFQQQPQMSNNVIGNVAENSYSGMQVNSNQVVNSIIGPSIGSSNNVIGVRQISYFNPVKLICKFQLPGNKAFNTNAGTVNSILINPK